MKAEKAILHPSSLIFRPSTVVRVVTLLFACGLAYEPLYHLVQGTLAYAVFPQDDFFYYYLTAKNIALHGFSSFDGIVPTNGYHPLWLWVMSAMAWLTRGSDQTFFVSLEITQIISAVISADLLARLLVRLYGRSTFVYAVALGAALLETVLIFTGMETVLAIPLLLWFGLVFLRLLEEVSWQSAILAGFVGALLILARLDAAIAIALAFVLLLILSIDRKAIAVFLLGLLPVAGYLVYNQVEFHNWIPVSAQVKQLQIGWHFNLRAIEAAFTPRGSLYVAGTIIGLFLAIRGWARGRTMDWPTATSILLLGFPILFALLLAVRVSWSSYLWYFYPFPISAAIGVLEIRRAIAWKPSRFSEPAAKVAIVAVIVFAAWFLWRDIPMMTTHFNLPPQHPYKHALNVMEFIRPGRYAMGDRAGITSFVTGLPILQLEGLAADQAMVDSISTQADLVNVFRHYGVDYYIVSYPISEFDERLGVWNVVEPHRQQVQPYVPVMHGRFSAVEEYCYPFPDPASLPRRWTDSSAFVTRILDVSRAVDELGSGKETQP